LSGLLRLPPPPTGLLFPHGLITYKDTKGKCRHLKKLTCKVFAAGVYQSL
jgi:hypothetical protein